MDVIALVLAFVLVAVNAFFVAAEFAIVKVRATRIEELISAHKPGAGMVRKVLGNIDAYLSACQLGITMASLALGWIGEPAFERLLRPAFDAIGLEQMLLALGLENPSWVKWITAGIAFVIITFLHITVGEQAPKSLALIRAETMALAIVYPLRLFYILLFPFIWLINVFSLLIVRVTGTEVKKDRGDLPTEEELKLIVAQARSAGLLSVSRSEVLRKAMSLPTKTAKHLMVPRNEVAFLDVNLGLEENLERAMVGDHTLFPLCDRELDDVIGVVDIRDILFRARRGDVDMRARATPPAYLPELMSGERLLSEFRGRHIAMAIIVDEYGGTSGILTAADVVTAVMGEFEDDEDEEVVALPGGVYDVEGTATIEEVEEVLNISIDARDMRTVAGFLMEQLGRMPRAGDRVVVSEHAFNVMAVSGPRIQKVRIQRHKPHERRQSGPHPLIPEE
ncbi:hemolysin family protein [Myxococcota bacterium]